MRRTILLAGVLPSASAFLGGVLAVTLMAAPLATAQSSELQEVRASAFTLVAADGMVLARLAPVGGGTGRLDLYDNAGTRRVSLVGSGAIVAYEQDGTTPAFRSGRTFEVSAAGNPPLNGVQLGPDGSIGMIPPSP